MSSSKGGLSFADQLAARRAAILKASSAPSLANVVAKKDTAAAHNSEVEKRSLQDNNEPMSSASTVSDSHQAATETKAPANPARNNLVVPTVVAEEPHAAVARPDWLDAMPVSLPSVKKDSSATTETTTLEPLAVETNLPSSSSAPKPIEVTNSLLTTEPMGISEIRESNDISKAPDAKGEEDTPAPKEGFDLLITDAETPAVESTASEAELVPRDGHDLLGLGTEAAVATSDAVETGDSILDREPVAEPEPVHASPPEPLMSEEGPVLDVQPPPTVQEEPIPITAKQDGKVNVEELETISEQNDAIAQESTAEQSPQHDDDDSLVPTAKQEAGKDESGKIFEPKETIVQVPSLPEQSQSSASHLNSAENDVLLVELQSSLQEQMNQRAEAENRARRAEERARKLQEELAEKSQVERQLEDLQAAMTALATEKSSLDLELEKLRQARDDFERKEIVLSNRLNAAKKKEAAQANKAEQLEDEVKELQADLDATRKQLEETRSSKQVSEQDSQRTEHDLTERLKQTEASLADERRLNDERKKKMKAFIETKQEELRQARSQTDELNQELEQTNRLLRDHNSRWKQLHAQWVQSQTRNRELQRDLNKIKKDSDNLHKMGDKMEMKMAQSAQETEEHKSKRLTAKHELMTVLRTLEAEREVSSKLRDSIKFTFTPKALSQQQLLRESLQDFESELQKLSRRLGRPLPPFDESMDPYSGDEGTDFVSDEVSATNDESVESDDGVNGGDNGSSRRSKSDLDSVHLLSNLEHETQRVSKCIMALSSRIERMHVLLNESGDRTCMTVLTDLIGGATGAHAIHSSHEEGASREETTSMTGGGASARLGLARSKRYGQVPTTAS